MQDPPVFIHGVNLASERMNSQVLYANDDFFAEKENLLKSGRGVFIPDKYTDRGKWMDGWETRRRRTPGHDWCIIQLGATGVIQGVDIDTHHFVGNYPEHASIDACCLDDEPDIDTLLHTQWTEILPKVRLQGGQQNFFEIDNQTRWTHLRLNIYPDGGVARLRVYGQVAVNWLALINSGEPINLAAIQNGGRAVLCSDMFFSAMDNLLMPGRGVNMGDGWETKRRRAPGNDWMIIQLGVAGSVHKIEVDTCHFKGNFPESCSVEGCYVENTPSDFLASRSLEWTEVLPRRPLAADTQHFFEDEILSTANFTHLRLNIYPDGGVSRFRAWGEPNSFVVFNHLPLEKAREELRRCCGASHWVKEMLSHYPFSDRQDMLNKAEQVFQTLEPSDWLEAFTHHPKIGDLDALRDKFAQTREWAANEQAGSVTAPEDIIQGLAEGNRLYEEKFGYIFIVCATGKSALEMLQMLNARLPHAPDKELPIAAEEQRKITKLRLEKL